MITQAKQAESAQDCTLALEKYHAALKWGVAYLEREPSARSKLKPTMKALMEKMKSLKKMAEEDQVAKRAVLALKIITLYKAANHLGVSSS